MILFFFVVECSEAVQSYLLEITHWSTLVELCHENITDYIVHCSIIIWIGSSVLMSSPSICRDYWLIQC